MAATITVLKAVIWPGKRTKRTKKHDHVMLRLAIPSPFGEGIETTDVDLMAPDGVAWCKEKLGIEPDIIQKEDP